MGEILCEDCLDTGWLYDREGRYVCPCIAETEPYILLKAEIERLKTEYHETLQMAANQASAIKTQIEEIERLREDAKRYRWLNARTGCITEGPDEECGIVVEMTLCVHTKDGGEQGLLTEWIDAAREGE